MSDPTTVALLDDHGIVLEGLTRLLERSGFDVLAAEHDPAVRAGATGFVIKDASPKTLVGRLDAVARGDMVLDGRIARNVVAPFPRRA